MFIGIVYAINTAITITINTIYTISITIMSITFLIFPIYVTFYFRIFHFFNYTFVYIVPSFLHFGQLVCRKLVL